VDNSQLSDFLDKNNIMPAVPLELSESNPLTLSVSDRVAITFSQAAVSKGVQIRGAGGGGNGGADNEHTYTLKFEGSEESDRVIDLGQQVRAVAGTDDPHVSKVIFSWIGPSGIAARTFEAALDSEEKAHDVFELGELGVWIVEADFGSGHVLRTNLNVKFFVIPESPAGAVALLASSSATIVLYYFVHMRRRRFQRNVRRGQRLL